MDRLPFRTRLDPRSAPERPIAESVNIPLEELASRVHELPAKGSRLEVVGPADLADQAISLLKSMGFDALFGVDGPGHALLSQACDRPTAGTDLEFADSIEPGRLWRPSPLIEQVLPQLKPGSAVDLGCGGGRDAVYLAANGWEVEAIDELPDAVSLGQRLEERYARAESTPILWRTGDIRVPESRDFDLLVNCFAFSVLMLPDLARWLRPGGSALIETFTPQHREKFGRPSASRVLPVERVAELSGMDVVQAEEIWVGERHIARVWLRRL